MKTPIGKHMVAVGTRFGWIVGTKDERDLLGQIRWHAKWRKWEFLPAVNSAFTWDCLKALSDFLFLQPAPAKVAT